MARAQSIGRQVQLMLYEHKGIGQSKGARREESGIRSLESGHKVSDNIHSTGSLHNIRNELTNLGKYAKASFGIKDMKNIDAEVVSDWIRDKDVSFKTASNYLSHLNTIHKHLSITPEDVAKIRTEIKTELQGATLQTRAYKGLDHVKMPKESQPAFELQRDYGLRVAAATRIIIDKQLDGNTLSYQEKGGKWSSKELNPNLMSKIKENAINGKYEVKYDVYKHEFKKEIHRIGENWNGTHGIRHSFAQRKIAEGYSKQEVSEMMGHSRTEIVNTYLR